MTFTPAFELYIKKFAPWRQYPAFYYSKKLNRQNTPGKLNCPVRRKGIFPTEVVWSFSLLFLTF